MPEPETRAEREDRLRDTLAAALNETSGPAFQRDFPDLEGAVKEAVAVIRAARGLERALKAIIPKNDLHEGLTDRARRHVREAQARERGAKLVEGALIYWQEINARGAEDYDTADVLADLREIAAALAVEEG